MFNIIIELCDNTESVSHLTPSQLQRGPVNEKYPHIVNIEAPDSASNHKENQSGTSSNGEKNFDMEGWFNGKSTTHSPLSYLDF